MIKVTDGSVMLLLKSAIDIALACDIKKYSYVIPEGMIDQKEILGCIEFNTDLAVRNGVDVNLVDEEAIRVAVKKAEVAILQISSIIGAV